MRAKELRTLYYDSFTDTAGTDVADHISESGHGYSMNYRGDATIEASGVTPITNDGFNFLSTGVGGEIKRAEWRFKTSNNDFLETAGLLLSDDSELITGSLIILATQSSGVSSISFQKVTTEENLVALVQAGEDIVTDINNPTTIIAEREGDILSVFTAEDPATKVTLDLSTLSADVTRSFRKMGVLTTSSIDLLARLYAMKAQG